MPLCVQWAPERWQREEGTGSYPFDPQSSFPSYFFKLDTIKAPNLYKKKSEQITRTQDLVPFNSGLDLGCGTDHMRL